MQFHTEFILQMDEYEILTSYCYFGVMPQNYAATVTNADSRISIHTTSANYTFYCYFAVPQVQTVCSGWCGQQPKIPAQPN